MKAAFPCCHYATGVSSILVQVLAFRSWVCSMEELGIQDYTHFITTTPKSVDGRREADLQYGYIHPCCAFPLSDLVIEVPAAK